MACKWPGPNLSNIPEHNSFYKASIISNPFYLSILYLIYSYYISFLNKIFPHSYWAFDHQKFPVTLPVLATVNDTHTHSRILSHFLSHFSAFFHPFHLPLSTSHLPISSARIALFHIEETMKFPLLSFYYSLLSIVSFRIITIPFDLSLFSVLSFIFISYSFPHVLSSRHSLECCNANINYTFGIKIRF